MVIKQEKDHDGGDRGTSLIENSFWVQGAGFTPILLAMGASVLAFAPSRRAVIVEGASDTILLPSLIREATDVKNIGFQVVPGIASISKEKAKELELEAPKVSYLVDGDGAGRALKKKLESSGIEGSAIISLPSGLVIEDLVHLDVFVDAVNALLHRFHGSGITIRKTDMQSTNRPQSVSIWCKSQKISAPSKAKVAAHIIAMRRGRRLLDRKRKADVVTLYDQIRRVLWS